MPSIPLNAPFLNNDVVVFEKCRYAFGIIDKINNDDDEEDNYVGKCSLQLDEGEMCSFCAEHQQEPDVILIVTCSPVFESKNGIYEFRFGAKFQDDVTNMNRKLGIYIILNKPEQIDSNLVLWYKLNIVRHGELLLTVSGVCQIDPTSGGVSKRIDIGDFFDEVLDQFGLKSSIAVEVQRKRVAPEEICYLRPLKNTVFSDVVLNVKGEQIPAHRLILASHSPVFAAMFTQDTIEKKNGYVEIPDMNPEYMKEMVLFMYSGRQPALNFQMALELFRCSDKYDVRDLCSLCERYLVTNLDSSNILEVLFFAEGMNVIANDLKTAATEYICKNSGELTNFVGYQQLLQMPQLHQHVTEALAASLESFRRSNPASEAMSVD